MPLEKSGDIVREAPSLEKKKNRALSRANRILRNFMIAGILLLGGYGKTTEIVFEYRAQTYYQEVERLKRIKQELDESFGTNSPIPISERIADMERVLKEAKGRYWNVLKPAPEIFECPFCNRLHSSSYRICPYYGLSLTPEAIRKAREEKEKVERQRVCQTTDIETSEGKIKEQQVKEYLDTLPEKWVSPSVKSITQTQEEYVSFYGGEQRSAFATCRRSTNGAEIKFHGVLKGVSLPYVMAVIGHEVAHANDWENERISFENRLDLLLKITKRIKADDRYKSAYVESIKENSPHKTNYTRAVEYWATITERYFSDPWELSIEDFLIVDDYIKRVNPGYNWKRSFEDRLKVIKKVRQDISSLEDNPSLAKNDTPNSQN